MATKKKKTENPDMQAPKEAQEALWNALGHNSLADPETPGIPGTISRRSTGTSPRRYRSCSRLSSASST
jgi:hypothetical protein